MLPQPPAKALAVPTMFGENMMELLHAHVYTSSTEQMASNEEIHCFVGLRALVLACMHETKVPSGRAPELAAHEASKAEADAAAHDDEARGPSDH